MKGKKYYKKLNIILASLTVLGLTDKEKQIRCSNLKNPFGLIKWVIRIRCPVCLNSEKYYSFYSCTLGENYFEKNCIQEDVNWQNELNEITIRNNQFKKMQKLFN